MSNLKQASGSGMFTISRDKFASKRKCDDKR